MGQSRAGTRPLICPAWRPRLPPPPPRPRPQHPSAVAQPMHAPWAPGPRPQAGQQPAICFYRRPHCNDLFLRASPSSASQGPRVRDQARLSVLSLTRTLSPSVLVAPRCICGLKEGACSPRETAGRVLPEGDLAGPGSPCKAPHRTLTELGALGLLSPGYALQSFCCQLEGFPKRSLLGSGPELTGPPFCFVAKSPRRGAPCLLGTLSCGHK